jgi:hypothetical protein
MSETACTYSNIDSTTDDSPAIVISDTSTYNGANV